MVFFWALACLLFHAAGAQATFRVAADPPPPPDRMWPLFVDGAFDSDIDEAEARDFSQGSDVTVGVIDQRIYAEHPKFAGRIDTEANFVTLEEECAGDAPTGRSDHGTLVAGLIVAQPGGPPAVANMAGLAPGARIQPIRAVNDCGDASLDAVDQGIRYAKQASLPVVVIALDTDPLLPVGEQQEIAARLDAAFSYASDTLFVVAAGNEGNDNDVPGRRVYPCSSTAVNVVCVGMTGEAVRNENGVVVVPAPFTDAPVCWGNVGADSVDLFAPGLGIFSTARGASGAAYAYAEGTSMAAPLVAATAALVEATSPRSFGPGELKSALTGGVDVHDELVPWSTSGGRLNAGRTLHGAGKVFGGSGASQPWKSCNRDHDQLTDGNDRCPDAAGPRAFDGCPDSDGDGKIDIVDNCPSEPNEGWADTDGDARGDACDSTPRGPDSDGEGIADMDDACPFMHALTANGCPSADPPPPPPPPPPPVDPGSALPSPPSGLPGSVETPAAAPQIMYFKVGVTPRSCAKGRTCKKGARVTIKLSRRGTVALKIERRHGRTWRRVTGKSVTASMSSKSLTLRAGHGKSLPRGDYRVTATVGGVFKVKSFRV